MPDNEKPTWTTTDDEVKADPDMRSDPDENGGPASALPTAGDTEICETDRIREDKASYDGAQPPADHTDEGHAVGGSEGTTDGQ